MKIDKGFRQEVISLCYDALEAAGFTRYRAQGIDWPLCNGFHAWVGLNQGWEADYFEINPFVGIHVVQIDRLCELMTGWKYDRGSATYALHMGELAPDENAFRFYRNTNLKSEASRLADLYSTVGLSYARTIANYDALLPLLKDRVDMLGAYPERVACCLYLMGEVDRAYAFIKEFAAKEPDYFHTFATAFLSRIKN